MGRDISIRLVAVVVSAAACLGAPLANAQATSTPGNYTAQPAGPPPVAFAEDLPPELPGMAFGMAKEAFVGIIESKKLTPVTNTAKTMFLVQPPGAAYSSVVYFFDSNAGQILSEIELRFADEAKAQAYFMAKYPPQYGAGSQYIHSKGDLPYRVVAWTNLTKVYVVATMQNTRWVNKN